MRRNGADGAPLPVVETVTPRQHPGGLMRAGLMVVSFLVVASCHGTATVDTGAPEPATTAASNVGVPAPTEASPTTSAVADLFVEQLRGDLAPPCSYIDADEMGGVVGTEMVAEDAYGTDCFYEATAGMSAGPDVHIGAYLLPSDQCPDALQTEPVFEGETVESVDHGDAAVLIVGTYSTEIDVCHDGVFVNVAVLGDEGTSAETRRSVAEAVVGLLLERL